MSTAAVVDAMAARHSHRCHVDDLVAVTPGRVVFGLAAMIRFVPRREDLREPERHDLAALLAQAAGSEPAGRVLVMDSGGHPEASLAGSKKLARLCALGMLGVVCDGRLRDTAGLEDLGIGAWCAGQTLRWAGDRLMPLAAGVPVVLGGVTVVPGDWVLADDAGVAVVPAGDVDAVLRDALEVERRDAATLARLTAEGPGPAPA